MSRINIGKADQYVEEADAATTWNIELGSYNLSNAVKGVEFEDEISQPGNFTLDLVLDPGEINGGDRLRIDKEGVGAFNGVVTKPERSSQRNDTIKGGGASELLRDIPINFEKINTNTQDIVNSVFSQLNTSDIQVGTNEELSDGNGNVSVRAEDEGALSVLNRTVLSHGGEWYVSYDEANDVFNFNVVNKLESGSVQRTFSDEAIRELRDAKVVDEEYDAIVVKGYGDGDDQVVGEYPARNTWPSDPKVLRYTDKTILSPEEANSTAESLYNEHTEWRNIYLYPANDNELLSLGDQVTIDDSATGINNTFRVVHRKFTVDYGEGEGIEYVLSDRPVGIIDEAEDVKDQTDSETDYMQGSRNIWSDKESANASNQQPLEIDFEVPQDIIDKANNNKLNKVEMNYACTSYKQQGESTPVTADNFDPSIKVVGTDMAPNSVQVEKSDIKQHAHPVGSSTTLAATGRSFLTNSTGFSFTNTIPSNGWEKLGGQVLAATEPENDIAHRIRMDIQSISSTANLHFAVLAGGNVANFEYQPLSPVAGEQITFEDTSSESEVFTTDEWHWDFGDGNTAVITSSPGDTTHTYSTSGTYTVKLELYNSSGTLIDDVTKDVEVRSSTQAAKAELDTESQSIKTKELTNNPEHHLGTQDRGSVATSFTVPADSVEYMVIDQDETNRFWGYSLDIQETDTSVCDSTDLEGYWQKDNNTSYFRRVMDEPNSDLCDLVTYIGVGPGSLGPDPDDPFVGAGRYNPSIVVDNSTLNRDIIDPDLPWHVCSRIVDDIDATPDPDGDDQSEVGIEVDGWIGRGIDEIEFWVGEDDGSDTGSNASVEETAFIDGNTIELMEGESATFDLDGTSHTVEVVEIRDSFGAEAELKVDGTNEGDFDEDDVVVEEDFGEQQLRVRSVVNEYPIEFEGSETGDTYSGIVLETYLDNFDREISGFAEGDYVAHVRFYNDNHSSSELKDPFLYTMEHDTFTINLNDPPSADFTFSPSSPVEFENIDFTDQSTDPDGDSTIQKWEWDFGDGDTETLTSGGNTTKSYQDAGDYNITLTVTDNEGATDSITKSITIGEGKSLDQTVAMSGADNVGGAPSAQLSTSNPNTVALSGVSQIGAQASPAGDSYLLESFFIPYRDISDEYEVFVATQGSKSVDVTGDLRLQALNHEHDMPRQDDFDDVDADVGAGAENKELPYEKAATDKGEAILDFTANDDTLTLDTTINGNDVTIEVTQFDSNGNVVRRHELSANNGTVTTQDANRLEGTGNTYNAEDVAVDIKSANNTDEFELRSDGGVDAYDLAASPQERFQSSSTRQDTDTVSGSGSSKEIVESVSDELLSGQQADNVRIYIDDDPDNDSTNSEQEITGDLYGGANDSGKSKDKGLDITQYISDPGWYRLKIVPNSPSFIKSRVFLDQHKDSS